MTEKEKWELLHEIVCRYINNSEIEYSERETASKEIIPYIEQFESKENAKIVPAFQAMVFDTPSVFKPGDAVYSFETEDYFPALFIMPDNYNGERDFIPAVLMVDNGSGFIITNSKTLYHNDCCKYRYATDEEKKLFKRYGY